MWGGNGALVVVALESNHIYAQILGRKESEDFHPLSLENVFTDYEGS